VGREQGMLDDRGNFVDTAGPSTPVEILGLTVVPQPGERFRKVQRKRSQRCIFALAQIRREEDATRTKRLTLEEAYSRCSRGKRLS
jgi:translation initiation factor IF-2